MFYVVQVQVTLGSQVLDTHTLWISGTNSEEYARKKAAHMALDCWQAFPDAQAEILSVRTVKEEE